MHLARRVVVLLANNQRVQDARGRIEWIYGRIDPLLRNCPVEYGCGIQVRKGGGGCRIGQVIGGNINRLHRGNRSLGGRGNTLLHGAHIGCQCWLIAHRRRDAAKQRRNFRTGLGKAEYVIDKEQNVLPLFVAEVLCLGKTRQSHTRTRAWRLVHLSIDQRHLGVIAFKIDNASVDHLVVELVSFAGPLAHPGKDRIATMTLGDIVNQLLDQYRFAHSSAAKKANFAALSIRLEQVDNLNTGHQYFGFCRLLRKVWCGAVNWPVRGRRNRVTLVNGISRHIHNAA